MSLKVQKHQAAKKPQAVSLSENSSAQEGSLIDSSSVSSLNSELENLKTQKTSKQSEVDSSKQEKEEGVTQRQGEITNLASEISSLNSQLSSAQSATDSAYAAWQNALSQANSANSTQGENGETSSDSASQIDVSALESAYNQALANEQAIQEQITQKEQEKEEKETELSEFESEKDQEISQGEADVKDIDTQISAKEAEIKQAQEQEKQTSQTDGVNQDNTEAMDTLNDESSTEAQIQQQIFATQEEISEKYDEWIEQQLSANGLKHTSLGDNETNFAEYGAALNQEVKDMITNSIGDEEGDYELQQKLAGLYQNTNYINTNDFIESCRQMGLDVSSEYVSTQYLVDAKATGGGQAGLNENGAIDVLTITDPETGATIKIADTNGNGAIEVEEVFMNELLSGVSTMIDTSNFSKSINAHSSATSVDEARSEIQEQAEEYKSELDEEKGIDNRQTISLSSKSAIIDKLKQQFIAKGNDSFTAAVLASKIVENNYKFSYDGEKLSGDEIDTAANSLKNKM